MLMKILVQNCLNHLFLKTLSEWTPESTEAKCFATSENALAFCMEHQIAAVQVVLKFDYDRYDIKVPITEECEEPTARRN